MSGLHLCQCLGGPPLCDLRALAPRQCRPERQCGQRGRQPRVCPQPPTCRRPPHREKALSSTSGGGWARERGGGRERGRGGGRRSAVGPRVPQPCTPGSAGCPKCRGRCQHVPSPTAGPQGATQTRWVRVCWTLTGVVAGRERDAPLSKTLNGVVVFHCEQTTQLLGRRLPLARSPHQSPQLRTWSFLRGTPYLRHSLAATVVLVPPEGTARQQGLLPLPSRLMLMPSLSSQQHQRPRPPVHPLQPLYPPLPHPLQRHPRLQLRSLYRPQLRLPPPPLHCPRLQSSHPPQCPPVPHQPLHHPCQAHGLDPSRHLDGRVLHSAVGSNWRPWAVQVRGARKRARVAAIPPPCTPHASHQMPPAPQ